MGVWSQPAADSAAGGQFTHPWARSLEDSSLSARVQGSSFVWTLISLCPHFSIPFLSKHLKSFPFPSLNSVVPHRFLTPTSSSALASSHEHPHASSHEDSGVLQGPSSEGHGRQLPAEPVPLPAAARLAATHALVWKQASESSPQAGRVRFPTLESL